MKAAYLNSLLPYTFGDEIEFLTTLASDVLPEKADVVMLGCGPGIMALALHEGNPLLNFSTVDVANFNSYIAHMLDAGFLPGDMLNMTTHQASQRFADSSLDLLIVDADHTYSGVKQDIEDWWDKVKVGGIIFFHDFIALEEDNGVAEAIKDSADLFWKEIARPGISIVYRKLA